MTKESKVKVSLKLDLRTAASIRQILFEHQNGYSYKHVPERISNIRSVIVEIDNQLENLTK